MTKRWDVSAEHPRDEALVEAAGLLAAGGIVAYPTDTFYGLGAHPWLPAAVRRLFDVKRRDPLQAIPLVAADEAQVEAALGALSPLARRLAHAFWPGPLTLVVAAPDTLPRELVGHGGTIAVRVPAHALARALAGRLGAPVTSTSANRSGHPPTADPETVLGTLGDAIDGLLDAGPCPGGLASTIVDVSGGVPRLLRSGAVPWDRVVQFLA